MEEKSVVIKLTNEQKVAVKQATGKDISELRVDALEGWITPWTDLNAADPGVELRRTKPARPQTVWMLRPTSRPGRPPEAGTGDSGSASFVALFTSTVGLQNDLRQGALIVLLSRGCAVNEVDYQVAYSLSRPV